MTSLRIRRVRRAPARVDAVDGIERIRFTSPHPKDFREPVIEAIADCDAVCEHAHLPLQSGSTRILKAMRRTYSRERYLRLVAELRDGIPGLALATDIIVGFPGETDDDFAETIEVVEEVGFDSAFTFVYSPRAGHRGGRDARPGSGTRSKRERIERLVEVVQRCAAERNTARIGSVEEVLVEGHSRTDADPPPRAHASQHDGQLRGGRSARAACRRANRECDVDDSRRRPARDRCRLETSSGTAASTSASSAVCRRWTGARRAAERSCARTTSGN